MCPLCLTDQLYSPVCGNDGRTYATKCRMMEESCETKRDITAAKEEPCGMWLCHLRHTKYYYWCQILLSV